MCWTECSVAGTGERWTSTRRKRCCRIVATGRSWCATVRTSATSSASVSGRKVALITPASSITRVRTTRVLHYFQCLSGRGFPLTPLTVSAGLDMGEFSPSTQSSVIHSNPTRVHNAHRKGYFLPRRIKHQSRTVLEQSSSHVHCESKTRHPNRVYNFAKY